MKRRRVLIHVLGCKVNQYDAGMITGHLSARGLQIVDGPPADVVVVCCCVVTHTAEAKSRQAIRRLRRENPGALLIATGCGVNRDDLSIGGMEEVDRCVGGLPRSALDQILTIVGGDVPGPDYHPVPITSRTRALVKVQEGCDVHCHYCIVPSVRGKPVSRDREDILAEVGSLVDRGFREVVVCGTNLALYGSDTGGSGSLAELMEWLAHTIGSVRFRLSSLEPMYVTPGLASDLLSIDAVCPHLHLVLQSGSDRILARMGRRYSTEQFTRIVEAARHMDPGCAITTDVIIGYPGETDPDFRDSLEFVRATGFSRLHVFRFSPRVGTRAAELPDQVPNAIVNERTRMMAELGQELSQQFGRSMINRELTVLIERVSDSGARGLSGNYLDVTVPEYKGEANRLVRVRVSGLTPGGVSGTVDDKQSDARG